jgi:hypothetical protein
MAANLPAHRRFLHALRDPETTQKEKLFTLLKQNAHTAFGRQHSFQSISSYEEFVREVPISDYSTLESWITRIRSGEHAVLTSASVTHLVPTSGSTGARKLIPFTTALQTDFNAAIAPWMLDLCRQYPAILSGRAYWSITPSLGASDSEPSQIPIGFDDDTAYLAGPKRALAAATMAVPNSVGRAPSLEAFQYQTWLHLLSCADLRLISVWHPSFLTLLLNALPTFWKKLVRRQPSLSAATPDRPETFWPNLKLISCWADGATSNSISALRRWFPKVAIQPKGLLATECFVSIPFQGNYPICVTSHFFEFINSQGDILQLYNLQHGHEYEVIVTTSGGLWRYRLGDQIRVTGFLEKTPTIQFLGRGDDVSDWFGEKLSEQFVTKTLSELFGDETQTPAFAMLAPEQDESGYRYILFIEGLETDPGADTLDQLLRRNPNYAYCRDLGQLLPPKLAPITNGFQTFAARQSKTGARLGDIKPKSLSPKTGWTQYFTAAPLETTPPSHGDLNR